MNRMTDQTVLVAFDVLAETHEQAAQVVRDRLSVVDVLAHRAYRPILSGEQPEIEAWWMPESRDRRIDGSERDGISWSLTVTATASAARRRLRMVRRRRRSA